MKIVKISLSLMCCLLIVHSALLAQSEEVSNKPKCNRVRIVVKTLIPNILGGGAEFVLPTANNRWSLAADYSRIGIPEAVATALDFEGSVKAHVSYLAIGPNFYLNNKGRGGGAYLGLRYQQITAKTTIVAEDSYSGEGKQKALAFLFGVTSGGHFSVGFEIGAGKPLGNATGSYVEVVNGKSTRTNYSESIIPVIPILNVKFGVAF